VVQRVFCYVFIYLSTPATNASSLVVQEAEAPLHAPHGTPLLGPHGDEAAHVLLVLGDVGVPHLGAGQAAARHAAGHLLLRTHPEIGARQGEAKAAHLIHECRVNDSSGCTAFGLDGAGTGDGVETMIHLFLLGGLYRRGGPRNQFLFLGSLCKRCMLTHCKRCICNL